MQMLRNAQGVFSEHVGVINLKDIVFLSPRDVNHRSRPDNLLPDSITCLMLPCILDISIESLRIKRKTYRRFNLARVYTSQRHGINEHQLALFCRSKKNGSSYPIQIEKVCEILLICSYTKEKWYMRRLLRNVHLSQGRFIMLSPPNLISLSRRRRLERDRFSH